MKQYYYYSILAVIIVLNAVAAPLAAKTSAQSFTACAIQHSFQPILLRK